MGTIYGGIVRPEDGCKISKAKYEMGSIYSLAGGLISTMPPVVIGPDLYYDTQDHKIKVDRNHYYDNKVKKGVTEEELTSFLLDTYAVLMTRGILGTYVYVCDPNLRQYLQKFIPLA